MSVQIAQSKYLNIVLSAVLRQWPEHESYLGSGLKQYDAKELGVVEQLAEKILLLIGNDLDRYAANYRWMCDQFFREEVYFRRHRKYRLEKFADAQTMVYGNEEFMKQYMEGLMLSQVLWTNHARGAVYFIDDFLSSLTAPFDYLEIGPGHGLFAAYAANHPLCRGFAGWDVSLTSLKHTQESLKKMGIQRELTIECRDIVQVEDADGDRDVVVISEVLEHLEEPSRALATVRNALRPGGHVFVNIPINSPAPDHIYLLRSPEEVAQLVESAGFRIVDRRSFPATGYDLKTALDRDLTVSCIVVAERV